MKQRALGALRQIWLQMGQRSRRLPITVQRSVNVGQKATATMIEVNGELLLLGVTNSAVTLIRRWHGGNGLEVRGEVR